MYVNVKTLIMLMLFLEQTHGRPGARGHHVGDPCTRVSQAAVGTFNDPQSPVCWPDTWDIIPGGARSVYFNNNQICETSFQGVTWDII